MLVTVDGRVGIIEDLPRDGLWKISCGGMKLMLYADEFQSQFPMKTIKKKYPRTFNVSKVVHYDPPF